MRSLWTIARDPGRLDAVLRLGEAVNRPALPHVRSLFARDGEPTAILTERPLIVEGHVDFDALERLPDGTLGREYVRFLRTNGITPEVFRETPAGYGARAAYVAQRLRQTHDVWHVVTGYAPDVDGELRLQAFSLAQLHTPMSALLAALGMVRFHRPGLFGALVHAFRAGRKAASFAGVYWEKRWEKPVLDVRRELNIPDQGLAFAA